METLEEVLYRKVKAVMAGWEEEGIYAVSFFVEANLAYSYREYYNVPAFAISYNTEEDCEGAGLHSEKRWNYAFWRQEETPIIEPEDDSPEMALLFDWYKELGLKNIGEQDAEHPDPVGYPELVGLVAKVARRLQEEGFLKAKFGHTIPIIIHDLEYADDTLEATVYANPNGEAEDFLAGDWESEESAFAVGVIPGQIMDVLKSPQMMEKLKAVSPWLPEDYIRQMLEDLSGDQK